MTRAPSRAQVLGFRWRRHGLDAPPDSVRPVDVALLDGGVQDTGPDGAALALALRGARLACAADLADADLFLAWTLRGAPHAYRRRDVAAITTATAPYSEADAAKRIFDAAKRFRDADIAVLDALDVIAGEMRTIAAKPVTKGEMSSALTARLDPPYLRNCVPCNAIHTYEQPFRLAALQAGLELEPGTSPPVLRRIPKVKPARYAHLADDAEPRFDVIRNYLRFYGPADRKEVAAFVDMPLKEVTARWPDDTIEVTTGRFVLADDEDALREGRAAGGVVRLLGPFDPYLQTRDRLGLVPSEANRKDIFRTIGRPGGVAVDGDIVGTWRPKTSGRKLTVNVDLWKRVPKATHPAIEEQAERLAAFRGVTLAAVASA